MIQLAYIFLLVVQHCTNKLVKAETPFPCASQDGFGLSKCSSASLPLTFLYDTYGSPDTGRGGRHSPYLDLDIKLMEYTAEYAVIVSLHDHAGVVNETVASLLSKTWGSFELVLVFDDCLDNTLIEVHQLIRSWLSSSDFEQTQCQSSVLTRIRCIVQPTSVWETSSDNIGMRASQPTGFYLLVQADMKIYEAGYNLKMSVPTEVYNDLFAISARCSHNLVSRAHGDAAVGRCGEDIGRHLDSSFAANYGKCVFVRESVNRGPLLLRADRATSLGFFDERNFILENDDHNMMLRALINYGWKSGYFHIDFVAPLEYGARRRSTKRSPSPSQTLYLQDRHNQIDLSEHTSMLRHISRCSLSRGVVSL
ncbi:TPA: hypothetical protein ACH3X3_001246 [Trebouxia sp. C0006]